MDAKRWFAVVLFVLAIVGWQMLVQRIFRKKE